MGDKNKEKRNKRIGKTIEMSKIRGDLKLDFSKKTKNKQKELNTKDKNTKQNSANKSYENKSIQHKNKKTDKKSDKPKNNTSKFNIDIFSKIKNKNKSADEKEKKLASKNFSLIEGGKSPKNRIKKLIIAIVCALLIMAVVIFRINAPTGMGEYIKCMMASSVGGKGYPVSFDDATSKQLYVQNNQLISLTDTTLYAHNSAGGLIYSTPHGMSSPVVRISKVRSLVFDRGGTQYFINNFDSVLSNKKADNKIIDADIADCGNYVIATLSEDEKSVVTVYDSNNLERFRIKSSENYVSRVAISSDGKSIAVVTVNAVESVITSIVTMYSINSDKPVSSKTFADENIYSLKFLNNKKIVLISKNRCITFDKNSNLNELSFEGKTLVKFEHLPNKNVLICLAGGSLSSKNEIMIINSDLKSISKFNINTTVDKISASNNRIYVLSGTICAYSYSGEKISDSDVQTGVADIKAVFSKVAVLHSSSIEML